MDLGRAVEIGGALMDGVGPLMRRGICPFPVRQLDGAKCTDSELDDVRSLLATEHASPVTSRVFDSLNLVSGFVGCTGTWDGEGQSLPQDVLLNITYVP